MSSRTDHSHPVEAAARPRKRLAIALVGGSVLVLLGLLIFVGTQPQQEKASPHTSNVSASSEVVKASSSGNNEIEQIEASLLSASSSQQSPSQSPSSSSDARSQPQLLTEPTRWYPHKLTVRGDIRWVPLYIRRLESPTHSVRHTSTAWAVVKRPSHPQLPLVRE